MKNKLAHIALLLLTVFAFTVLPFNMLHHHAEHEHLAAVHQHQLANHSCELDDHFCQPNLDQACQHQAHVSAPVSKCFSCEFHFIKHFDNSPSSFIWNANELTPQIAKRIQTRLQKALTQISNKGPPKA